MSNNGTSSAVIARHDYLPFGEEISLGIGSRSSSQGYSAIDNNRWKYGMLQRDAATGLDHTPWRKFESLSGRWTSPDPLDGSLGDPQSFNHYAYVGNDPGKKKRGQALRFAIPRTWEISRLSLAKDITTNRNSRAARLYFR